LWVILTYKALGVKRRYFPRERLPAAFCWPDIRTSVAAVAETTPSAIRLVLSAADAEHLRPTVEANRTQHSCRLRRPSPTGPSGCARNPSWPVPILIGSQHRRHSTSDWLTPRRACPVRLGWRLGRIVRAKAPRIPGRGLAGVGRILGWPQAKPVTLGQRHAEPAGPPTHRRIATCLATTAVEIRGHGRRPIKPSGCLGGPRPHRRSRCSLGWLGSS
jgi:hypothetical protein